MSTVAGGGHEPKDGALQGKTALDYLKLAATIVLRELKEESYDSVEGFENVSTFHLFLSHSSSPTFSSFKLQSPTLLHLRDRASL